MCSHILWNVKFQPTWLKNTKYLLTEYPAGFFNCHLLFTWQSIKLYFSFTKKIWGCYSTSGEAITCKSVPQKNAQPSLQPCGEWMSWWRSFLLLYLLPFLCLHVMLLPEKQNQTFFFIILKFDRCSRFSSVPLKNSGFSTDYLLNYLFG